MDKKIMKFDDTEIEEYEFHQHKSHISINDMDINEIVVSNKLLFHKQGFKSSLVTNIIKKLDLYTYSFQKCVYIKDILIKLNVCIL